MKKPILLFFGIIVIIGLISLIFSSKQFVAKDCEVPIYRFEQDFFKIKKDSFDIQFNKLKNKYPNFFIDTSISFNQSIFLDDTLRSVLDSVTFLYGLKLPGLDKIKEGFCKYKSYFPHDTVSLYTFIDKSFDYRTPVVYSQDKLFISLHLFLGKDHSFYNFLPDYIKFSHDTMFIPSSCFITLAGKHIPYPESENFLDVIMYYSKSYFFTKKMLPNILDYQLFKCTEDKMNWCYDNESAIWKYMIEKDYLFSSSLELVDKFVNLAPFSQFGFAGDVHSPGSVGIWLGLQIWESYCETNDVSLVEVLQETNYKKVLNQSAYKP
ncbi:MAG: hypothetical protein CMP49_04060 [Flavobacteriales bacterium]|nr:hypothetical protein [Flavobacteriales bacterium]|tara:strand:- start:684 stop:1649 length:966 start_codon:yes stop_codon:yes gene_type:complete